MTKFCISQVGYPKVIVYNGDTIVAISEKQLDKVNAEHIQNLAYQELTDSLNNTIKKQKIIIVDYKELIDLLKLNMNSFDYITENFKELLALREEEIKFLTKQNKKLKRRNNVLKFVSIGTSAVAVTTTVLLLVQP